MHQPAMKKTNVSFNKNNKRVQNRDSSDSDSTSKNNNIAILTVQITELESIMKSITANLDNINSRIAKLDSNNNLVNKLSCKGQL